MASNGIGAQSKSDGKVTTKGETNTWGFASDTALNIALERLARSLRQWLIDQLEFQLAQERRTIDIRIEQESDRKAQHKAAQLLKANHKWISSERQRLQILSQRSEDARRWLNWLFKTIGRSANTKIFFILWTLTIAGWGWVGGINTPAMIVCHTQQDSCYRMRFWAVKLAIADLPATKCTKTRQGLTCLLPEPKVKLHKARNSKTSQK